MPSHDHRSHRDRHENHRRRERFDPSHYDQNPDHEKYENRKKHSMSRRDRSRSPLDRSDGGLTREQIVIQRRKERERERNKTNENRYDRDSVKKEKSADDEAFPVISYNPDDASKISRKKGNTEKEEWYRGLINILYSLKFLTGT